MFENENCNVKTSSNLQSLKHIFEYLNISFSLYCSSQSDTGLMLRDSASGQPRTKRVSPYHYYTLIKSSFQSLVSTLRATPVLSAWAAVNQLASLPISELTEPPPPPSYESALNISTEPFDRPQSVIIVR